MIPKYHEQSQEVSIHSQKHTECKPDHLTDEERSQGWECQCSDCKCDYVVNVKAAYAYDQANDHKVIITTNPGGNVSALTPDVARALAAALNFAAIDAETLNKEFPA